MLEEIEFVLIDKYMKINIVSIEDATDGEWSESLDSCQHATYFHSREWAEIWHLYDDLVPRAKKIVFSDKQIIILPCSYYLSKRKVIKSVMMSPGGTFGGALYGEGITIDHLKLVIQEIKKFPLVTWRQNPYESLIQYVWNDLNHCYSLQKDITCVMNLDVGFETIYKGWRNRSSMYRKVHKARKAGINFREGKSEKDWLGYYMAYEATLKRWGDKASRRYSWKLFQILYERQSPRIKLWLVELDGEIIAGAICFYQNKHAVYWHGAAYAQYFKLRPVNLLHFEIIRNACESSYNWYDFNPSDGQEGVVNFKMSFGCKIYDCDIWNYKSASIQVIRLIRQFLPRKAQIG